MTPTTPVSQSQSNRIQAQVEDLQVAHPKIRAADWRSPLVLRLIGAPTYSNGSKTLRDSFRATEIGAEQVIQLELCWQGLAADFAQCVNTYQEYRLTEMSALGLACILVTHHAALEITEVTRLGDKTDYWLGDRQVMLEVSGQQNGNLDALCGAKAVAVRTNPFGKDGYVCVVDFASGEVRLWFFDFPKSSQ